LANRIPYAVTDMPSQIAMKFDLHSPACFLEIHEEDLAQQLSMCDYEFFKPILVGPLPLSAFVTLLSLALLQLSANFEWLIYLCPAERISASSLDQALSLRAVSKSDRLHQSVQCSYSLGCAPHRHTGECEGASARHCEVYLVPEGALLSRSTFYHFTLLFLSVCARSVGVPLMRVYSN
jgi:hypothetical protein